MREHSIKGVFFAILAALFLALMGLAVKNAEGVPEETLIFSRGILGSLVALPIIFQKHLSFKTKRPILFSFRVFLGFGATFCYFYTSRYIDLANAVLLFTTAPLFVPLIVFLWLKCKIPKRRMIALLLGFIGIIIVLKPSENILESRESLIGVLGAVFSALSLVALRILSKTENPKVILFYYSFGIAIISIIPMTIYWEPIVGFHGWCSVFLVALMANCYQYSLIQASKEIKPTQASSFLKCDVWNTFRLGRLWNDPDTFSYSGWYIDYWKRCLGVITSERGCPYGEN